MNTCTSAPVHSRWQLFARLALGFGVIAVILVLAHRPLLVGFAYLFRVDDPAPSDALIVLIGGADHRPAKTAELYLRGLAPTILLGETGTIPVLNLDEEDLTRRFLESEGVPAAAVQVLPGGEVTSTRDEAMRLLDYARIHPMRRITIVTSGFHATRARWIFRRSLRGMGIDIRIAAAEHPKFNEANWYRTEDGLVQYFGELIKGIFYYIKY